METNCGFIVKSKSQKQLELVADIIAKAIEAQERDYSDTISEIDEEEMSFSVEMESGCGVNAIEYIMTVDYILRKHGIKGVCFDVEGVEDLDYGAYTAFMLNYNDGDIAVKSIPFEGDDFEPDYYDDDEEDDYDEDEIDGLTEDEKIQSAEEEAFERLKEIPYQTDLSLCGLMGEIVPVDEEVLDAIVLDT